MDATVIDTLRYADRLKDAGVEGRQAEAMSRAINDELTGGVATKDDLGHAVAELTAELKAEIAEVNAKFDAMEAKFDARLDAVDQKFDARLDTVDQKFEAMDAKFDALNGKLEAHGRYVFLVLALIAALGLYNAIASNFVPRETATSDTAPAVPTAKGQVSHPATNAATHAPNIVP